MSKPLANWAESKGEDGKSESNCRKGGLVGQENPPRGRRKDLSFNHGGVGLG